VREQASLIRVALAALLLTGATSPRPSPARGEIPAAHAAGRLRVATTTSLYDSGLWDTLEPLFERETGLELDILYAGTGIALEYGRRGDVDAIAVHSPRREAEFIAEGFGVERVPFARNSFLIVAPPDDPAGLRGLSPEAAFRALQRRASTPFISRGDDSGTHERELEIWRRAGIDPDALRAAGAGWYIESGRGMGPTLQMASEKGACTLCDIGTFLAWRGRLDLVPVVRRGEALRNTYSVIVCTAANASPARRAAADALVRFLVSPEIQARIGAFGEERFGEPLFEPVALPPAPAPRDPPPAPATDFAP